MSATNSRLASAAQRACLALVDDLDGRATALIATADGFAIGHAGTNRVDPARLAAVISSIAALGNAASVETDIGATKSLVVDSNDGRMVMRCLSVAGESLVVVLLTDAQVLMGRVLNRLGDAGRLMEAR